MSIEEGTVAIAVILYTPSARTSIRVNGKVYAVDHGEAALVYVSPGPLVIAAEALNTSGVPFRSWDDGVTSRTRSFTAREGDYFDLVACYSWS